MKNKILAVSFLAALSSVNAQDRYFLSASGLASLSTNPIQVELRLEPQLFSEVKVGTAIPSVSLKPLLKAYGKSINVNNVEFLATGLPAGVELVDGVLTGTPAEAGDFTFTVTASYENSQIARTYSLPVYAEIHEVAGIRSWADGSLASSCAEYISSTGTYRYAGATGDGVYSIEPVPGQPMNVLCDMTRDGGGWTLVMKQAQGDGVTLQGDTTYWTNGTVLNDSLPNLNKNNGNLVSAAFSRVSALAYRMEASNEATMKYHTLMMPQPPLQAFSNSNRVIHTSGTTLAAVSSVARPDWFVRTSTYPNGSALGSASFLFNQGTTYSTYPIMCAVRWGWLANNEVLNGEAVALSHDACAGLGGYGQQYGNEQMSNNKNSWQLATLYLWVK